MTKIDMDKSDREANRELGKWAMNQIIEDPKGINRNYDKGTQFAVLSAALLFVRMDHAEHCLKAFEDKLASCEENADKWLIAKSPNFEQTKAAKEAMAYVFSDLKAFLEQCRDVTATKWGKDEPSAYNKENEIFNETEYTGFMDPKVRKKALAEYRKCHPPISKGESDERQNS